MILDVQDYPRDAVVLVEGGHYTPRPLPVHGQRGDVELTEPGFYLVVVASDAPRLPGEIVRDAAHPRQPNLVPAILKIEHGATARFSTKSDCDVLKFEPPSESEVSTLRRAAELAKRLEPEVAKVELGILIGNLQIPVGIRHCARQMLPAAYSAVLAEHALGGETVLFLESTCRNKGAEKVINLAKRLLDSPDKLESLYAERGVTVFRDDDDDFHDPSLYLCSEYTVSERFLAPSLVPLTRGRVTPACGTTLAGRLHQAWRRGCTHMISLYSALDDPEIRRKNVEGSVIAGSLFDDSYTLSTIHVTLDEEPSEHVVDRFEAHRLRRPGHRPCAEALELFGCGRDGALSFTGPRTTGSMVCCPYKPLEVRRRDRPR